MTRALRCFGFGALLALAACQSDINPDNPDAALPYRCVRDGGYSDGGFSDGGDPQCPGDFICGLEGYCHKRTEEKAYPCEGDFDCAPTWRCGVSLNPQVLPTCHPRGVTADYACRVDNDCEEPRDGGPKWRCGPQRACLDPAEDELRRNANYGPLDGGLVSPQLFQQLPQHLAGGHGDFSTQSTSVAWVESGNLGFLRHHERGRDGGAGQPLVYNDVVRVPLNPPVRALEVADNHAYVLDQAGLGDYVWRDGSGLTRTRLVAIAPAAGQKLRYLPGFGELPAMHEPTRLLMFRADAGPSSMAAPPGTGILDVSGIAPSVLQQGRLIALTDGGIYVRGWDPNTGPTSADWTAQSMGAVTNTACWPAGSPAITEGYFATSVGERFAVGDVFNPEYRLPVVLRPFRADGGCATGCLAALGTATSWDAGTCMPVAGLPNAVVEGPCPVCDPGSMAIEVRSYLHHVSTNPALTARIYVAGCQRANGTQYLDFVQMGPMGCDNLEMDDLNLNYLEAPPELSVRVGRGLSASAGAHGQLWLWTDGQARAVTPPRIPLMLSGRGNDLTAYVAPELNTTYAFTPGAGLVWLATAHNEARDLYYNQMFAFAPVAGRPGWAFANAGLGVLDLRTLQAGSNLPTSIARYEPGLAPNRETTGYVIQTPDGEMLVATMGDALAAGLLLTDGGTVLEARMSPSPGSRIIDSVLLPPQPPPEDGGTVPVAEGYVLTNNSLVQIAALNAHRWRARPVEIPYDQADAVGVWADGYRGRVGYDDGVVFSLPSRIPIAPRLPGGEKVRSYADLCGQGFALSTGNNLYRLVPSSSGGIGTWQREDLAGLAGPGFDPTQVKLYSTGDELYVMGTYGTVSRLTISGGCR